MPYATQPIESLSINTIRTLAMDAVQAANSGHPGTPMALAPATYVLFNEVLRYDPAQPQWPNRDRFILSCGHASMLLYATLHVCGVKQADAEGRGSDKPAVPLDDIRLFRQLGSLCPGHPEHGLTSGVETTTGPLGQGISNSVGMAIAQRWLAAHYNRPGFDLFSYNVYALCSDGDLMEGVGAEAASLAGHLKLSNLCWIYDDNKITIEGSTNLAFSENVAERFAGYGWNVLKVDDINDLAAFRAALAGFRKTTDRPTMIIVRSVIAWGAPNKHNTHGAHGSPLGEEEIRLTKRAYGWPEDQKFLVPEEVLAHFRANLGVRGQALRQSWEACYAQYAAQFPEQARELELIRRRELPQGWDAGIKPFAADAKGLATRASSGKVLEPDCRAAAVAGGRGGRPGPLDAHAHGRRRSRGRKLRRPEYALRHPRARHGRDHQRHDALRAALLRVHLLCLHRLHAALDPHGGHHGPAGVLRLHARFDRRGRRRSHAPAGRAPGRAEGDSQSHGHSPRRRERGGRGLSFRALEQPRADGPGALAAERADARPRQVCPGRRRAAAAMSWPTRPPASRK